MLQVGDRSIAPSDEVLPTRSSLHKPVAVWTSAVGYTANNDKFYLSKVVQNSKNLDTEYTIFIQYLMMKMAMLNL